MDIISLFQKHYQTTAIPEVYSAPGRVNLIGEHTDYNEGYVLPMAIEFRTNLALTLRDDDKIRVYSRTLQKQAEFRLHDQLDLAHRDWHYYIGGVLQLLQKEFTLTGADIFIDSNLPMGAGLSSSASLEVVTAYAFLKSHHHPIDLVQIAKLCQKAEHIYAGTQCGIMDQFICSLAHENQALLIDCQSLEFETIDLKMDNLLWAIVDTDIHHSLATSEYNTRRQECEKGALIIGVHSLRYATLSDLIAAKDKMTPTIYQRCHHVITENERVLRATHAMKKQAWHQLGELMIASHRSLQYDYQVSCKELDFLVDTAINIPGVQGARMTGGGFGGCTINLIEEACFENFKNTISESYLKQFGHAPKIYHSKPQVGVKKIS